MDLNYSSGQPAGAGCCWNGTCRWHYKVLWQNETRRYCTIAVVSFRLLYLLVNNLKAFFYY